MEIHTNKNKGDYEIKRGEIYYISQGDIYETVGSEQRSGRPAVIVSNDANNIHSDVVEVVFLTTKVKKELPTHISIDSSTYPSIALCEQIKTFSKQRIGDYMGAVTPDEMQELERGMAISIGLTGLLNKQEEKDDLIKQLRYDIAKYKEGAEKAATKPDENAKKYKTERDVYKKMYEQLLERVLSSTAE